MISVMKIRMQWSKYKTELYSTDSYQELTPTNPVQHHTMIPPAMGHHEDSSV